MYFLLCQNLDAQSIYYIQNMRTGKIDAYFAPTSRLKSGK